jgi:hypothetical protein
MLHHGRDGLWVGVSCLLSVAACKQGMLKTTFTSCLLSHYIIISGSACSTGGVHSQTRSTSGVGLGSKSGRGKTAAQFATCQSLRASCQHAMCFSVVLTAGKKMMARRGTMLGDAGGVHGNASGVRRSIFVCFIVLYRCVACAGVLQLEASEMLQRGFSTRRSDDERRYPNIGKGSLGPSVSQRSRHGFQNPPVPDVRLDIYTVHPRPFSVTQFLTALLGQQLK